MSRKAKVPQLPEVRPVTDPNFRLKVRRHQDWLKANGALGKADHAMRQVILINASLAELGVTDERPLQAVVDTRLALEALTRELRLVVADTKEKLDDVLEPGDVIR